MAHDFIDGQAKSLFCETRDFDNDVMAQRYARELSKREHGFIVVSTVVNAHMIFRANWSK